MQENLFEIFERMLEYNFDSGDMGECEWPYMDKNQKTIMFKCKFNVLEYNANGSIIQNLIIYMDSDMNEEEFISFPPSNV